MKRTKSPSSVELPAKFTDVLYLTNRGSIPPEIRRLLKHRKLSYCILAIEKFAEIRDRLDLIGTVIIDSEDSALAQGHMVRIIELLEMEHIGVILLTGRTQVPIKSFSISPTRASFSMADTVEGISIDELWTRLSVNLAYRKSGPGMAVKPALPPRPTHTNYKNRLSEQLTMTKALAETLTEQLRLAGLVQQDFLPGKLPNTEQLQWATVFLPAEWVSGDIYDVVRVDEEHIGFYIADVVGHGMPAALLTIFLKQALVMRETIGNEYRLFSPAEAVASLNVRMAAQKLSGYQFATCCYCLLNIETLQVTFARAGHPYPILIRPGEQPKQLEVRGSLLGIFEQAEYLDCTVQLKPGDKLLLYSDGIEPYIGNFTEKGGFVFTEEFHKIKDLPIAEITASFKAHMESQQLESTEIDDVTVVALEIAPEILSR